MAKRKEPEHERLVDPDDVPTLRGPAPDMEAIRKAMEQRKAEQEAADSEPTLPNVKKKG